ncbi:MAG: TonB-dependent receptor [Pseudomonadota bacterium]
MSKNFLMIGAAAVAMSAYGAPALAQDSAEEEAESRQDVITVTARKTEESIQDIPISVSAFSGDQLLEQNIDGISELSDFTAGFQQQQAFGRDGDRPVIRGTSNILTADGKVGIFVDGIPFFGDSSSLDLSNLERVEVIKGPQSAVFGRGTLSGAINYVTRKPGDETFQGQIRAEAGEFGHQEISGFANFRVNDWIAFSVHGKSFETDGAFDNELGGKLGAQSTDTYGGAIFVDPFADLSISARYLRAEDDDGHFAIALTDVADNNCFLDTRGYICGTVPTPTTFAINTDDLLEPGLFRESDRGFVDVNWDVLGSGYELNWQAGITDIYERSGVDQTYDENTAFFFGAACRFFITNCDPSNSAFNGTGASRRTALTNEVRLSSPQDQQFRWRVGAFMSDEQRKPLAEFIEFTEFGPDTLGDVTEVENLAFFGGVEYDVNDKLTIGFELRHAEDDITAREQQYVLSQFVDPSVTSGLFQFPFNPAQPNQIVGSTDVREASFDSTAPRLTVDYRVNEDLLLYGQYSEGNSPGGFNPTDAPQTTFEEEKLKSFEVGAKTSKYGFDRLNVTGFFNVFENQVLTNTYTTGSGGVNSFRANIGETEILGLELEFTKYVTDNWVFYGSYGFLDAEITEGVDRDQAILRGGAQSIAVSGGSVCTDLSATIPAGGPFASCLEAGDITGNTPPLVSEHQLAVGSRIDLIESFEPADFYVGADMVYRSSFYAQVHNSAETGAEPQLNLRAGMDFDNFTIQLWGKNVLESDTPNGILRYVDFNAPRSPADRTRAFGLTPQTPTQWGLTGTLKF